MKFFRGLLLPIIALAAAHLCGNTPAPNPIVILISIDGGRWDYLAKYAPPTLCALAADGVQAERMIPCFPSSTFPNHYTLVTGLRPVHHGIISNNMFDPALNATFTLRNAGPRESRWWGGEPVWVTAEKQGITTACMFWPGSEAEIAGGRPTRWKPYDMQVTSEQRVDQVLAWLQLPATERPRFITLYFDIVDSAGHEHGPDALETRDALLEVDRAIGKLVRGVNSGGLASSVNYVVVADHGMTDISATRRIALDDFVDPATVQVDFSGYLVGLRPLDGDVDKLYQKFAGTHPHFRAWRREEIPASLHFSDNLRIPPVVLLPDPGWLILPREKMANDDRRGWKHGGAHGYDPADLAMNALFIACGPAFQSGRKIPPFENIHVYDLLCAALGIQPAPNDGDHRLASEVLRP
ncbi:MAG: alkaline phosphatase family protein [Opitutaceae bacterium]|nr:alkaline phosphatase family protein [Opitutaceae bacterium]